MVYKRGDYAISVEQIDGFGKNPGLWVYKGNQAFKMASFGGFNKAELFMKYLDYLFFNGKKPDVEYGDDGILSVSEYNESLKH